MKCRVMPSAFPRERKKCETNSEPLSEVTWEGTPCFENTCATKSFANSGEVMVSWVGMNIPCFERRSTTTRMEVNPSEEGSCSMKSMEMECQGRAGMGSCFRRP